MKQLILFACSIVNGSTEHTIEKNKINPQEIIQNLPDELKQEVYKYVIANFRKENNYCPFVEKGNEEASQEIGVGLINENCKNVKCLFHTIPIPGKLEKNTVEEIHVERDWDISQGKHIYFARFKNGEKRKILNEDSRIINKLRINVLIPKDQNKYTSRGLYSLPKRNYTLGLKNTIFKTNKKLEGVDSKVFIELIDLKNKKQEKIVFPEYRKISRIKFVRQTKRLVFLYVGWGERDLWCNSNGDSVYDLVTKKFYILKYDKGCGYLKKNAQNIPYFYEKLQKHSDLKSHFSLYRNGEEIINLINQANWICKRFDLKYSQDYSENYKLETLKDAARIHVYEIIEQLKSYKSGLRRRILWFTSKIPCEDVLSSDIKKRYTNPFEIIWNYLPLKNQEKVASIKPFKSTHLTIFNEMADINRWYGSYPTIKLAKK